MNYCYIFKQEKLLKDKCIAKFDFKIPDVSVNKTLFPYGLMWTIKFDMTVKNRSRNFFVISEKRKSEKKLMNRCIDYVLEYVFKLNGWVSYETEILLVLGDNNEIICDILEILSNFNAIYTILGEYNIVYDNIFLSKGLSVNFKKQIKQNVKIRILLNTECELIISDISYDDIELLICNDNDFISDHEYSVICREFGNREDFEFLFKNRYVKKMALKSKLSN